MNGCAWALTVALTTVACRRTPLEELDEVYYRGDNDRVVCAVGFDDATGNDLSWMMPGLDRAAARGEVVQLYAHGPGRTVPVETVTGLLDAAASRGLPFVTYREFEDRAPGPGLALSFDDKDVARWAALRPDFDRVGAKVTFFITRFDRFTQEELALLQQLANDGHDIEAHGKNHLDAPQLAADAGLRRFESDELLPNIQGLRAAGYPAVVYAYPFGARTSDTDRVALQHVERVRAVTFSVDGVIADACPE